MTFGVLCYRLTWKGFSNYSALMKEELKLLEEKINQFVQLCHHQRTENMQLREKLSEITSENNNLSEKISGAISRLDTENNQLRQQLTEATSENKNLSEKISGATSLLGTENTQLREQLAEATSENKNLSEKISGATNRLEALLTQFPNSPIISNISND